MMTLGNGKMSMDIADAQRDMRQAYVSGASGALVSGAIWLVARLAGGSGKHAPANPLARLAMEGTVYMLLCLPVAVVVFLYNSAWFFPAMLLNIAGRYLTFQTLYGMRTYWLLSATLVLGAVALVLSGAGPAAGALVGGGVEIVFAVVLFLTHRAEAVVAQGVE